MIDGVTKITGSPCKGFSDRLSGTEGEGEGGGGGGEEEEREKRRGQEEKN